MSEVFSRDELQALAMKVFDMVVELRQKGDYYLAQADALDETVRYLKDRVKAADSASES